jgi:hypothetical protein
MIELQALRIEEASAGEPLCDFFVAKRATKPLLAMTLALILYRVSVSLHTYTQG